MTTERVAVVLTGAAARGAFQAGALAAVIPAVTAAGYRPSIYLGTSAGAINAALWASFLHHGAERAATQVVDVWRSMDRAQVLRHPGLSLLHDAVGLLPGALVGRGPGLPSLLDTSPLQQTAARVLDGRQLADNVAHGVVDAVGVVATRLPGREPIADGRSVVFLDTTLDPAPVADPRRAVDVAVGPVDDHHVMASCAIPAAFPAIQVEHPVDYAGWYNDGGVRLNAPLRPAVRLGADRIVVVAANATRHGDPVPPGNESRPDVADGLAMAMHAILADQMRDDLAQLSTRNRLVEQAGNRAPLRNSAGAPYRRIATLQVAPEPGLLARTAAEVVAAKQRHWWSLLNESDTLALQRLLRGLGEGSGQEELLSYVLFDEEYFAAQLEIGRRAGEQALAAGWGFD